jgi:hypothetical protein
MLAALAKRGAPDVAVRNFATPDDTATPDEPATDDSTLEVA